jgi:hypothetical protein
MTISHSIHQRTWNVQRDYISLVGFNYSEQPSMYQYCFVLWKLQIKILARRFFMVFPSSSWKNAGTSKIIP